MKIIAQQDGGRYLIALDDHKSVLVDWDKKKAYPPFNTDSIIARGYWEDYDGPQELLESFKPLIEKVMK